MEVKILKIENLGECKKSIQIEIPGEELTPKIESVYKEVAKSVQVPGFRVGHVPRKILETRFGKRIRQQAVEELIPTAVEQAIKDANLSLISSPTVTEIQDSPNNPVQITILVEVRPEFEVTNYKGLTVKKEVVVVTEEEVDKVLSQLQEQHAEFIPVIDRNAQPGDFLIIDFEGTIDKKKFNGSSAKGYFFELGKQEVFPEFESVLVNQPAGTVTTATVTYPTDHHNQALAGKTAVFTITLREIKRKQLPPLDDEFAKDVGNYNSLAELKEKIELDLKNKKEAEQLHKMKQQIIDQLVQSVSMELPASMVDRYSKYLLGRQSLRLRQAGLSYESLGTTVEKAKEESIEIAKKQVKASFILEAIADLEKITVSDEEIEAEINHIANYNQIEPAKYKEYLINEKRIDGLRDQLREDKVLQFLIDHAQVELAGSRIVLPK
ncbi:MAG: trigger factor [bacterium]|nr:trigger factor [bacterium]